MNGKSFVNESLMVYKHYKRKHPNKMVVIIHGNNCVTFDKEHEMDKIVDEPNSLNVIHVEVSEYGYSFEKKYLKNTDPMEVICLTIE